MRSAVPGSIPAWTAAILPPATATSSLPPSPEPGSTTSPPVMTRSYRPLAEPSVATLTPIARETLFRHRTGARYGRPEILSSAASRTRLHFRAQTDTEVGFHETCPFLRHLGRARYGDRGRFGHLREEQRPRAE